MATVTALASNNTGRTGYGSPTNIANAYTDTTSTNYAQLPLAKNSTCGIYFTGFDFSSIPSNASITGITVKFKGCVTSTTSNIVSSATVQAYANTTAKGSSTSFKSTTVSVYELSVGTWTRAELDTLRIYVYTKCSNKASSSYYTRVYGMEVTVTYEEITQMLYYKNNGTWVPATKVYQKVSGAWVEVTDLSTIDRTKNWVRGS